MTKYLKNLAWIVLAVCGLVACKGKVDDPEPPTPPQEETLNQKIHNHLKEWYLYDDEYQTLSPNFAQDYDAFVQNTLMGMKTNVLDKKLVDKTTNKYALFSYIEKVDPNLVTASLTRATKQAKEKEYSFGVIGAIPVKYDKSGLYELYVKAVYPDSPAEKAGIKRGSIIRKKAGKTLDRSAVAALWTELVLPGKAGLKLEFSDEKDKVYKLTSEAMYCNPVLKKSITTDGVHKIGYLVYSRFDKAFDEELYEVFKEFKKENINQLILDFRYNGGGDVQSANLIASCVAGVATRGKIFASYRYNTRQMAKVGGKKQEYLFDYDAYYNLNNISLSDGDLGLKHVYCLVTNATASASELVINALRGIDVTVTLVGTTTHGKNVGMIVKELTDTDKTKYRLVPVTFQTYNAKNFGDYENGFEPDVTLNENNPRNDGYFWGYFDFGDEQEHLYAKAVALITGRASRASAAIAVPAVSERTALHLPDVRVRGIIER